MERPQPPETECEQQGNCRIAEHKKLGIREGRRNHEFFVDDRCMFLELVTATPHIKYIFCYASCALCQYIYHKTAGVLVPAVVTPMGRRILAVAHRLFWPDFACCLCLLLAACWLLAISVRAGFACQSDAACVFGESETERILSYSVSCVKPAALR